MTLSLAARRRLSRRAHERRAHGPVPLDDTGCACENEIDRCLMAGERLDPDAIAVAAMRRLRLSSHYATPHQPRLVPDHQAVLAVVRVRLALRQQVEAAEAAARAAGIAPDVSEPPRPRKHERGQ